MFSTLISRTPVHGAVLVGLALPESTRWGGVLSGVLLTLPKSPAITTPPPDINNNTTESELDEMDTSMTTDDITHNTMHDNTMLEPRPN